MNPLWPIFAILGVGVHILGFHPKARGTWLGDALNFGGGAICGFGIMQVVATW